jgi:hypothetical protein
MPESSTRARLREASAIVETATKELAQAEVMAKKAVTQKELATATVQKSTLTNNVAIQWRINALKASSTDPMPADLAEARRESALAQENLEHAEAVLSHLNLEYEAAQENLRSAQKEKDDAVNALMTQEVEHIVDEIKELGRRRQYLRDILRGVSLVNASRDQHQKLSLLVEPSMHDHSIAQLAYPPSSPGSKKYWRDFSGALSSDPDAELGQLPAAADLWS